MVKKYLRTISRHFIIWTSAFIFWALMREFGQEVLREFEPFTIIQRVRLHVAIGIVAALIFGSLEFLFEKYIFKHVSLRKAMLIGSISYLLSVILLITFGIRIFTKLIGQEMNWEMYSDYLFSNEMILLVFYCYLIGFFVDLFKEINKKLGPGNLWKMMKGEFYRPKEDERIFMFLDLKSSTATAEKLGHLQYSKLIQDCFHDLRVVEQYNAEVYQYVGDEAVLTWETSAGLMNANCVRAYFEFTKRLSARADYYKENYGILPEFKAGLNIGKITIAEVGEIKTEIAYHGDTINTAARIQQQCNAFGKNVLISEFLQENLSLENSFSSDLVGEILLKGKQKKINIYSIEDSFD